MQAGVPVPRQEALGRQDLAAGEPLCTCNACSMNNSHKWLHFPAHVLGVCGPSPIPPGRLVLGATTRTGSLHTYECIAFICIID